MRIYRLHDKSDYKKGPFRVNWTFGALVIDHPAPQEMMEMDNPWRTVLNNRKAFCAWVTASKMHGFLMNRKAWRTVLMDMAVSVIEVEENGYCILPDGQVLFTWDSATIVQTITDPNELAELAEQEN